MAIQVNGTTVINDSRALTNIASVDATTVAALGAAGVGGGGEWASAGSTVTTSWYNVTSGNNTVDTGWWDLTPTISNLPSDYKFIYIVVRPEMTYNGSGSTSEYFYFYDSDALRVGSSSSNYQLFAENSNYGTPFTYSSYGFSGKYGYIGGIGSYYPYDKIASAAAIGTLDVPPNVPTPPAQYYQGTFVSSLLSHFLTPGDLVYNNNDNKLTATYGQNIGYLAWRKYNTGSSLTTTSGSFQFRYVFSTVYFK